MRKADDLTASWTSYKEDETKKSGREMCERIKCDANDANAKIN